MTPQERITFIIENCAGGSQRRLAEDVGIDVTVVSRLKSGQLGSSSREGLGRFAERIYRAYPELDAAWLLTGEGDPFTNKKRNISKSVMHRIEALEEAVEELKNALNRATCATKT